MERWPNPNQLTLFEINVGDFAIRSIYNVYQLFDELEDAGEQLPDNVVPIFRVSSPPPPEAA